MGAMLFALWAGTVVWTINDIRARSWDVLAMILAAVLVILVPFAGLVVYILVRPRETLADTYNRALEEEALLREANVSFFCTGCSRPVRDTWVFCPHCQVQLLQACPACGHAVRPEWTVCAQCGTARGTQPARQYPQAEPVRNLGTRPPPPPPTPGPRPPSRSPGAEIPGPRAGSPTAATIRNIAALAELPCADLPYPWR